MAYRVISPCSEDWGKMRPAEGGRFCDKCQKKVYDLTQGMSLPESTKKMCGRVRKERISTIRFNELFWRQRPLRYVALMILLLITRNTCAQSDRSTQDTSTDLQNSADSLKKKITLTGVLKDKHNKEPLPFATVEALDDSGKVLGKAVSDLKGRYKMSLEAVKCRHISIRSKYIGYMTTLVRDIPVTTGKKSININLTQDPGVIELGLIIYCPPPWDLDNSGRTFSREDFLHHPKG